MKKGFSLIEVLIAMAISSAVVLIVYQSLSQMKRISRRLVSTLDKTGISLVYNQLGKDISGICVPVCSDTNDKDKQEPVAQKQEAPDSVSQNVDEKKSEEKEKKKKKSPVPLVVDSVGQESVKKISFITTNALSVYESTAPRMVKVEYKLKPSKHDATYFDLVRIEKSFSGKQDEEVSSGDEKSDESDIAAVREYRLISDIRKMSIRCSARPPKKESKEPQDSQPAPFETLTHWGDDEQRKKIEKKLPEYIEVDITFGDPVLKREYTYTWLYPVPAHTESEAKKKDAAPKSALTPTTSKSDQAGQAPVGQPGSAVAPSQPGMALPPLSPKPQGKS